MRIAVDVMGGDHAPADMVQGALDASRSFGIPVALVGREERIEPLLTSGMTEGADFSIVEAPESIDPGERPAQAVRTKRLSSIVLGVEMVKAGKASAFVSAGNTGAVLTAAMLGLGKIMRRPALGAPLPTFSGAPLLLLDAGASVDVRPEDLAEYATVGSLYVERVLHVPRPKVGLLNIGSEEGKGNEQVRAAYALLKELPIEFVGNIEGRDLLSGEIQVAVCDGFVGNVMLKVIEGLGSGLFGMLREELGRSMKGRIGGLFVRHRLRALGGRMDYTNYGGAPLFGVRGPVIKCHGSSRVAAVRNGVRVAREYVSCGAVDAMEAALRQGRNA